MLRASLHSSSRPTRPLPRLPTALTKPSPSFLSSKSACCSRLTRWRAVMASWPRRSSRTRNSQTRSSAHSTTTLTSSSRSKTKWWRSCASSKTPKSSSKTQSGSKFQAGAGTKTRLCLACRNSCSRFKTSWESSNSRCSRKSWLVKRVTSKRSSAGCRAQANERKPPASLSQGCDLRAGITKQEIRGLD